MIVLQIGEFKTEKNSGFRFVRLQKEIETPLGTASLTCFVKVKADAIKCAEGEEIVLPAAMENQLRWQF